MIIFWNCFNFWWFDSFRILKSISARCFSWIFFGNRNFWIIF